MNPENEPFRQPLAITAGPGSSLTNHGDNVNQGFIQNFYDEQYIAPEPVSEPDLAATRGQRFVEPTDTDQWTAAQVALRNNGLVVLLGPVGSGRRTTALRLLKLARQTENALFHLEPNWSKPKKRYLPRQTNAGAVLDMSFPSPDSPDASFGEDLVEYGRQCLGREQFTVVLSTPQVWKDTLADKTQDLIFRFDPPDARTLIARELQLRDLSQRVAWLSDGQLPLLPEILDSQPYPEEALRLYRIIRDANDRDSLKEPLQEFTGWRDHIEDTLLYPAAGTNLTDVLTTRAVLWSAALLNKASIRSVISCSNLLLQCLKVSREPGVIAQEATTRRKLHAAHVSVQGSRAALNDNKSNLDRAVLEHLFTQYPDLRKVLLEWISALLTSTSVSKADLAPAVTRLVTLAGDLADSELLRTVAGGLPPSRRTLAVDALTKATLSPEHGAYTRNQIYRWARGKPDEDTLSLVAEICGGELGVRKPAVALTRLRLVAENAPRGGLAALSKAVSDLADHHPDLIRETVASWLDDPELQNAGRNVFLALAGTDEGRTLLLGADGEHLLTIEGRAWLVRAWQNVLEGQKRGSPVEHTLRAWGDLLGNGLLPPATTGLLAEVLEPGVDTLTYTLLGIDSPGWEDVRGTVVRIRDAKRSRTQE
jgi:hypothetical protein